MTFSARYMLTGERGGGIARTVLKMLGATVQNLVAQVTSSQGCVYMWQSIPKETESSSNCVFSVFNEEVTEISTA